MHSSSLVHMTKLIEQYLHPDQALQILDIGSYDINGSYKPLLSSVNWRYIGIDLSSGPNVDLVLNSPYRFPLRSNYADLIVSGQTFEHTEFFWLTWLEMVRVLKPGGRIFLIVPSRGPEHRYPVDCWRFYPDALHALAKYGSLELLEAHTDWLPDNDPGSAAWGDTVGVFHKPYTRMSLQVKQKIKNYLSRFLAP